MAELIPEPASREPNMRFIFWRHVPDNVPAVLEELESADVMLLESSPVLPKREKIVRSALMNHFLGAALTRQQRGALAYQWGPELLEATYEDANKGELAKLYEPVELGILERYHGSGKIVRLLDANSKEQPEIAEQVHATIRLALDFNAGVQHGETSSLEAAEGDYLKYLTLFAQSSRARELVVAEQLAEHHEAFPDKKLAVVYGAGHTVISHPWLRRRMATRVFIDTIQGPKGLKQLYNIDAEISRRIEYGLPVAGELAIRGMLKNSLVSLWGEARGRVLGTDAAELVSYEDDTNDLRVAADYRARLASVAELATYAAVLDTALKNPSDETQTDLTLYLERF